MAASVRAKSRRSSAGALVALYNSTNGPGWANKSGWLATNTPCSWYGVGCFGGHVDTLNLYTNQLSGTLPPELGDLANLSNLNLNTNQLSGAIPPELGNVTSLSNLSMELNQLSGHVPPQLGNLTGLLGLYLSDNQLTGALPQELTWLASLGEFWFNNTGLCEPPDAGFQGWLDDIVSVERTGVFCAAQAVTTGIARDGNNVVLTWTHQEPNTEYEVYRSLTPYFAPTPASLLPPALPAPTAIYVDTGAIGSTNNYFYIVRSKFRDSANDPSADSNQVGKYRYPLGPGN
jgi:hypothetical protein